jgi:hypothetical protein
MNGKIGGIQIPPWTFAGRGPQNNMESLLVSVSEFEPQASFKVVLAQVSV